MESEVRKILDKLYFHKWGTKEEGGKDIDCALAELRRVIEGKKKELPKPSIEELEKLLSETKKGEIILQPDGSIIGINTSAQAYQEGITFGYNTSITEIAELFRQEI